MSERRKFLKRFFRLSLFGGLGIGGVYLTTQKQNNESVNEVCQRDGLCRQCPLLKKCGTPTARSYKEAIK